MPEPEPQVPASDDELAREMMQYQATQTPPVPPVTVATPRVSTVSGNFSYWNWLVDVTGNDILQMFGDTGSGKTKTSLMFVEKVAREGKKVVYFDCESNLDKTRLVNMPFTYVAIESLDEMQGVVQRFMREKWDLMVIDSPTIFITENWFAKRPDERGQMLQRIQYMYGKLKRYCHKNNAVVILTAQPTSTMMTPVRSIVGDKAQFFIKVTIECFVEYLPSGAIAKRELKFFKSRNHPPGRLLSPLVIDDNGAHLDEPALLKAIGG